MFKKLTLGVLGLVFVGGLLFGGNMLPYVSTAVSKARQAAKQQVPIEFQIDAAQKQLEKIHPEVQTMLVEVAKEKAQLKRMETDLASNKENLEISRDQMMALKDHLTSGDQFYVAANSKTYANSRVREDLAHRLSLFKTAQETVDSQEQVLESRRSAIEAALAKLDEAKALQRELEVKIENLRAKNRLNQVAKTATNIDMDSSELARAANMLEDISAQVEADSEMLQMAPKYFGQIPVGQDSVLDDQDILQQMTEYFGDDVSTEVVSK